MLNRSPRPGLIPVFLLACGALSSVACVSQRAEPQAPVQSSLNAGSQYNSYGTLDDELDNETLRGLDESSYSSPFRASASSPFVPSAKPYAHNVGGGRGTKAPVRKFQQASTKRTASASSKRPMVKASKGGGKRKK